MASLQEIREGLAAALVPLEGVQQSAYVLWNPTPPAADVAPEGVDYHQAMESGSKWKLIVRVFVGAISDIGAQKRLDLYLAEEGAESVKALIEADSTLGGVVDDLIVTKCSGYRAYERAGGQPVVGAEWTVEIFT